MEQVLKTLTEYVNTDKWKWSAPQIGRDSCIKCIKALEKQIPIKPIGKYNVCPKCGGIEFGFNKPNYCEWCGQKLEWE